MTSLEPVPKDLRKIVRELLQDGWVMEAKKGGHIRLFKAGYGPIVVSASPSCKRSKMNFIAELRRATGGKYGR